MLDMKLTYVREIVAVSIALLGVACGSSAVPIDKITPDKKLVDLSGDEQQGICDWATQMTRQKFAASPSQGRCGGQPLTLSCMPVPQACPATVAQWMACLPNFVDRLAKDPCQVFQLAFSGSVDTFIEETPNCQGLGSCGFSMTSGQ
jgi:hypothetical protein